jgi:hypothetical protein
MQLGRWGGVVRHCSPHGYVVDQLATNCDFDLIPTQRDAWLAEIQLLHLQLNGANGSIFFEFNIPRMGRRIDVALVVGPVVFTVEFKVTAWIERRSHEPEMASAAD